MFIDKGEAEAFIAKFKKTMTEEVNDEEKNNGEEEEEEQSNHDNKVNEEKVIGNEGKTGCGTEEHHCLHDCKFEEHDIGDKRECEQNNDPLV